MSNLHFFDIKNFNSAIFYTKNFNFAIYYKLRVKSNFLFSIFKKFSFQLISAVCIQHKVGHFCYSL